MKLLIDGGMQDPCNTGQLIYIIYNFNYLADLADFKNP